MKKIWVLTREHNQYDQEGEYFVAAFASKPTHGRLAKVKNNLNPAWSIPQGISEQDRQRLLRIRSKALYCYKLAQWNRYVGFWKAFERIRDQCVAVDGH